MRFRRRQQNFVAAITYLLTGRTFFVAAGTIFVAGESNVVVKGGACASNIEFIRGLVPSKKIQKLEFQSTDWCSTRRREGCSLCYQLCFKKTIKKFNFNHFFMNLIIEFQVGGGGTRFLNYPR